MFQKIIHFTPLEKLKNLKKSSFLDSLTGFIKYHNAFAIGFMIVFVGFSISLAASPGLRENVKETLISTQEVVRSIDNSRILAVDLDNFDFGLQITEITEDDLNYYVSYSYKTLEVGDYAWQEVEKEKTFDVPKDALGGGDLGLYVTEQLGQVINNQLSYLKEVQEIEQKKGLTQKVATVQYAGLLGKFLSSKEKVFPGYEPVVKPPEIVSQPEIVQEPIVQEPICQPSEEICDGVDNNCDGQIDEGGVCPEGEPSAPYGAGEAVPPPVEDVCDAAHLNLCSAETDCQSAGSVWDSEKNTCNEKPKCEPNWQPSDWEPAANPDTLQCGESVTQTRTYTDTNECGVTEGKPADETQEMKGTLCSAENATGTCQTDGTCSFTCQDNFSNCDNDMSNGCETQGECQPPTQPDTRGEGVEK